MPKSKGPSDDNAATAEDAVEDLTELEEKILDMYTSSKVQKEFYMKVFGLKFHVSCTHMPFHVRPLLLPLQLHLTSWMMPCNLLLPLLLK